MGKLRILAAGDFHGNISVAEALAKKAEKEEVDVVILTGDLTHADTSSEGLIGPFVKRNKKVLVVPGNHDTQATINFLAERYGIKNLHGYSVKYKDVGIFGCGGATNVGPHFIISEGELATTLEKAHENIAYLKKKIMLTHMHPTGVLAERLAHEVVKPSTGVREMIEKLQPDVLICSHVHEAEGIEQLVGKTRVVNVGRHGTILEI